MTGTLNVSDIYSGGFKYGYNSFNLNIGNGAYDVRIGQ
jgi:hypothetical protein